MSISGVRTRSTQWASRLLAGVFICGLVVGVCALPGSGSAEQRARPGHKDWTSINFSNHNTGHDATERTLTSKTVHSLRPIVHRAIPRMGGPLIVSHGRLFGTCGADRRHVWICAWTTSSLARLWRARILGRSDELDLAAAAGTLIVHNDPDRLFFALRQVSGARQWRVREPNPIVTVGLPPPVVTPKTLNYVDNSGFVVRRSLRTGRQLSRVPPGSLPVDAQHNALLAELGGAIVVHHTVYRSVPEESAITAAPLTCGRHHVCPPVWAVPTKRPNARLIFADHRLFATEVTDDTSVEALNARTGRPEFTLRSDIGGRQSTLDVEYLAGARDLVFYSDDSGYLRAWKATGCGHRVCQPIWKSQPIKETRFTVPEIVETNGRLFTFGGYVYTTANVRHSPYGPPGAPSRIHANYDARNCILDLTWTPPSRTGHLPLTGGTATLRSGRVAYGVPTDTAFVGLAPGTYRAEVAVNNAWGHGPRTKATFTVPGPKCSV